MSWLRRLFYRYRVFLIVSQGVSITTVTMSFWTRLEAEQFCDAVSRIPNIQFQISWIPLYNPQPTQGDQQ